MLLHFLSGYNLFNNSIVFLAAVTLGYGPYNFIFLFFNLFGLTISNLGTFSFVNSI